MSDDVADDDTHRTDGNVVDNDTHRTDGGVTVDSAESAVSGDSTVTKRQTKQGLSVRFGRPLIKGVLALTTLFLIGPVVLTFVSSFAGSWTGVVPTQFFTLDNWFLALGYNELGASRGLGAGLQYSVLLALGGVVINLLVGIPIAYAIVRYDFPGRDLLSTFAILPLVSGLILGIAFLRTYPNLSSSGISLIIGYSLLKAPFMIVAVKSSFEAMDLRQLEESARSLGASWPRTFLTVIIPNAKQGIIAGSIICWTLAAAEFNFSYMVYSRGAKPFSLFLFSNISNSGILQAAAAVSIYFLIVATVTALLRASGTRGFTYGGR
jgi:putative spermidine/putrescine transport system permease protein